MISNKQHRHAAPKRQRPARPRPADPPQAPAARAMAGACRQPHRTLLATRVHNHLNRGVLGKAFNNKLSGSRECLLKG